MSLKGGVCHAEGPVLELGGGVRGVGRRETGGGGQSGEGVLWGKTGLGEGV